MRPHNLVSRLDALEAAGGGGVTTEGAQDAVGAMVDASLTYVDATPLLQRAALTGAITAAAGSNATALGAFTKAQLDTAVSDGNVLYVGDAPTSHTHPASEVSDSTTAGRAMLTAANVAAQTALLDNATTALKGLVPVATTASGRFLKDDLTWAAISSYGQLTADYTLANSGSAQKLFDFSTNGACTLATGRYLFRSIIYLTGMSGTSGNGAYSFAGTATVANVMLYAMGIDSTTPLAGGTVVGTATTSLPTNASMITAATGTGLTVILNGSFNITVTGTIIPSITLFTAIAAVVKAGSFFECSRIGDTGSNTVGSWT